MTAASSSPASLAGALALVFLAAAVAFSGEAAGALPRFAEAPEYRNGDRCPAVAAGVCDPGLVHIAMTLDAHYLRGSMAAIYSLLKHASCPESIFFHFMAAAPGEGELRRAVAASFPSLRFEIYPFHADAVAGLISASVRAALEAPLNYARNHLADLLPPCVPRAIYLDSDVLAVDDGEEEQVERQRPRGRGRPAGRRAAAEEPEGGDDGEEEQVERQQSRFGERERQQSGSATARERLGAFRFRRIREVARSPVSRPWAAPLRPIPRSKHEKSGAEPLRPTSPHLDPLTKHTLI